MNYLLMPLDSHYDSGFGAIATSFRDAALKLKEAVPNPAFFDHLPQSFLLRHAVELYFKSEIIIIHRRLKLPYDAEPFTGTPMIFTGQEWKLMHRVHNIGLLYKYWKMLINPRLDELRKICKHKPDWTITEGADDWVKLIDGVDPKSTYSRYPSMRDAKEDQDKSPFKEMTEEATFAKNAPKDRFTMALIVQNQHGEFVRGYASEKGIVHDTIYMQALEQLCDMLSNYHAMMRHELTGGY